MTAGRRPTGQIIALICAAIVAIAVVAVVIAVVPDRGSSPRKGRPDCPSARIRSSAGAAMPSHCVPLLGVATDPNTFRQLRAVEAQLGHRIDMTYRFHDLNDRIPTAEERTLAGSGRVLHISIDARIHGVQERRVAWSAVAAGAYDARLRAQAKGIASLGAPVLLTFDHEPDQPDHTTQGAPAQFVAAWRHVHDLFEAAGVTNVTWVWVVTGQLGQEQLAAKFWPGNTYVDWISWEAYDPNGCRTGSPDSTHVQTFAESALPFYDWLHSHGGQVGIDARKPMMISEAGAALYGTDIGAAADWYREMAVVLRQHPQIQAIGLWDRPGIEACRYNFDHYPLVVQALAQALRSPPFAVRP